MVDYDRLLSYGWTADLSAAYTGLLDTGWVPARVIRMDRSECDVATPDGLARTHCPRADTNINGLCTGDWVAVAPAETTAAAPAFTVRKLLPRRTVLQRATVSGRSDAQVLATNVDTVAICVAADGDIDLGRIERMLALVWESGAQPIVVLTKLRRLDSYRKLQRENERLAARNDVRLRAERERVWRDISKSQRRMYRERDSRRHRH